MSNSNASKFIPLATERTKNVVKHLAPRSHETIDAVSVLDPSQRIETTIWNVEQDDGIHTYFQEGPAGQTLHLGFADQVRIAIEEAATEDLSRRH